MDLRRRWRPPVPNNLYLLFVVVILLCISSPACAKWGHQLGPIGLRPKGYTWEAHVDPHNGKAYATETSLLPPDWTGRSLPKGQSQISLLQLQKVLGRYPRWLCRGSVTLGMLKAVPTGTRGQHIRIQTRLLGIPILTFGEPTGQRLVLQTVHGKQETLQWKYPILKGGLLTAPLVQSAANGGYLFVRLQLPLSSSAASSTRPRLETGLMDYTPRWVGRPRSRTSTSSKSSLLVCPPNPIRVGLYLGTQSVLHGYVMWRFHRYVRRYQP